MFLKKTKNKANKNSAPKSKIKDVYWPITAKITTSIQFPIKDCLIPHRYKINLKAHLGSRRPQIFTRCHGGVEVFSMDVFGAIALRT